MPFIINFMNICHMVRKLLEVNFKRCDTINSLQNKESK
jgi:hypothetical protein